MSTLFASLEEVDAPYNEEQELNTVQQESELEVHEIQEQEQEMKDDKETMDSGFASLESLYQVKALLKASVSANKGISADTSKLAAIAVEGICARLNYKPKAPVVPAIEAFGYSASKLDTTKEVIAALEGVIVDVWDAIKRFFAGIRDKIVHAWKYILDQSYRALGIAEELVKKADTYRAENYSFKEDAKMDYARYNEAFGSKDRDFKDRVVEMVGNHSKAIDALFVINKRYAQYSRKLDTSDYVMVEIPELNVIDKHAEFLYNNKLDTVNGEGFIQGDAYDGSEDKKVPLSLSDVAELVKENIAITKKLLENRNIEKEAQKAYTSLAMAVAEKDDADPESIKQMKKNAAAYLSFNTKFPALTLKLILLLNKFGTETLSIYKKKP